jgi:ribosomal protein S3AE
MPKPKVAKKEWYPIIGPKIFQNAVLGETYVYDANKILGKELRTNLMTLTNDSKRQNINIDFKVIQVENGKAFTSIIGYNMAPSSMRRLVRRNIEKIMMSFICKTSDNVLMKIKPLVITRASTSGSVATKIRKKVESFITNYISKISYDNFINDIVNHSLQSTLKKELSKIYPARVCEIRSMEIIDVSKNNPNLTGIDSKENTPQAVQSA